MANKNMSKPRKRARNPYQKAMDVVTDFCTSNRITSEELRNAPSTRTFNLLRQQLAERLRAETAVGGPSLSWAEIGAIIGRKNYRRKNPNSP